MMTTNVMSAGDGYRYYTNSVATGDIDRKPGTAVTDYYTADGNPPGVWIGGGTALVGVEGEVTEAQMRALFGEGIHPNADTISKEMQGKNATRQEIESAIALGRAYYRYDVKDTGLRQAVEAATAEFERVNHRSPNREERRQLRMREGAIAFREAYGRQPANKEELAKYVTTAMKPAQHAVAGIDHTFSVPKSVSIAWALGDKDTAEAIEGAHERAITRTLERLESEALATRAGTNGVRQIDVRGGMLATRFRHFESRTGDPHLHDHVVISNKVQGADGVWRTLDSRLLLRSTVFLSETYNKNLFDELEGIGYRVAARTVTAGKAPVLEISGVSDPLIEAFSTRSHGIKPVLDALVDEYTQQHGRAPDQVAARKLSEQAWQATRPAKKHRTLSELRADAWQRATKLGYVGRRPGRVPWAPTKQKKDAAVAVSRHAPLDVHQAAAMVMQRVESARSTWGEHHVKAEIERFVSLHRDRRFTVTDAGHTRDIDRAEAERMLLRTTLQLDSIRVTPEHVHGKFQPLTRRDGESFYTSKGRTLYTSTRILHAEARLLAAARHQSPTAAPATADVFARALADQPNKDTAQVALAREFATSRTRLVLGVGPAGAGKTRSMKLVAHTAHLAGGRVVGLAPSKKAATVFARDVGVEAFTIDAFLTAHRGAATTGQEPHERYRITPGDIVVVDEAAMATTASIDEIVRIVSDAGGYVRAVFDHNQISAVGAGGAMRWLHREVGAVELEKVYRFTNPEEGAASLVLRESAPEVDPFAWYKTNGRVIAGTREQLVEVIFTDYLADLDAGRESVMGVPTLDYLDELNTRAHAHAIATGEVTGTASAKLRDGNHAHVGTRIVTRLNSADLQMNQGRDSVENGSLFTVQKVHWDGSLTVTHTGHGGTVRLPSFYVRNHTHLGYAVTANGNQGETYGSAGTVEGVARGIVNASTTRAAAYVNATRGVTANYIYVEVEPGQHPDDVLAKIAGNVDTNVAAHEQIDREADRILDLARLVDEHNDVAARANMVRFETLARRVLTNPHPLLASNGWEAAAAGLARAEKHGMDPADVLKTTWGQRDFQGAEDIGAVMSWRIENHIAEQVEGGHYEPLTEPGTDTGYFEWAVDRSIRNHPDLPDEWKAHLGERADYIDRRMSLRGVELTIEQPEWSKQLGPVPADRKAQTRWMRLAAEVDLFRARYNIPDSETAAIPERFQGQALGKNLAARVAAMHKSTAIRAQAGTATPAAGTDQARRVTTLARKLETQRPVADAERAARALTSNRPTPTDARLTELLRKLEDRNEGIRRTTEQLADKAQKNQNVDVGTTTTPDVDAPTVRHKGPRIR